MSIVRRLFTHPRLRAALGPLLFIALLVGLFLNYRPPARPQIVPSWVVSFPFEWLPGNPRPTPVPVDGNHSGGLHVAITTAKNMYTDDEHTALATTIQSALHYVVARFQHQPTDTIAVYIGNEQGCNLNGIAYTDKRLIQLFTCRDIPQERTVNILAHEFIHQLAHDTYGEPHMHADIILSEGVATWGAGQYWLGGKPDFKTFVHDHYVQGAGLLPLATSYQGRPISDMNRLYYEWASFVEFLLQTYGRDQFDALYVTGNNTPGSADYTRIYGKTLDELETTWRVWLNT